MAVGRRPDLRATAHAADPWSVPGAGGYRIEFFCPMAIHAFGTNPRPASKRTTTERNSWSNKTMEEKSTIQDADSEDCNEARRQRSRNSQTPPKSELRYSKKHYIRRVQNGTFGTPLGEEKGPIRRPKTWRNLAWTSAKMQLLRNSQTPPKSELRYSKKQYIRRAQNGTFGTP